MSRFPILPLAALALAALSVCHHGLLCHERRALKPKGTPEPAYNFRSLYRLLSPAYQIADTISRTNVPKPLPCLTFLQARCPPHT